MDQNAWPDPICLILESTLTCLMAKSSVFLEIFLSFPIGKRMNQDASWSKREPIETDGCWRNLLSPTNSTSFTNSQSWIRMEISNNLKRVLIDSLISKFFQDKISKSKETSSIIWKVVYISRVSLPTTSSRSVP